MDLEDRMSLLLQLASCFLAFLTEAEGVLKSVEKVQVLVRPVVLKNPKERRMRSLSIPLPFSLACWFSSQMKRSLPFALPEYKGQKSMFSSQGDVWAIQLTGCWDEHLSVLPCPPRHVLPACWALPRPLATMMQSVFCQQHSAQGKRQNLTWTTNTTEIFMGPCSLHLFILPEAFAPQKLQLFCYITRPIGKKRICSTSFLLVPRAPELEMDPLSLPLFLLGLRWNESVLFQFGTTHSSMH